MERVRGTGDYPFRTNALERAHVVARLYLSDGLDEAALEHLVTVLDDKGEADYHRHDRHIGPAIVMALYMYGDRFSADQINRIRSVVTRETLEPYRPRSQGSLRNTRSEWRIQLLGRYEERRGRLYSL